MIIHKMKATFGTLAGEELKLGEGLNIIYAPNESGKSTWCAFLKAMLYGVDTSQRGKNGQLPDKTKYAPWSGAPMEGEIRLTHGGKDITLRRTTPSERAPMRDFTAVYTGTDIPVPELTALDAGEQLTGATAEVFSRTAFIGQGSVGVTGTPELERRIAAIVTSGEESCSWSEADSQLRSWQRKRRSGSRGALPEIEREIALQEEKLERLQENADRRALLERELEENQREIQRLTNSMNDARQRQRKTALAQMGEEKAHLQQLEDSLAAARQDAAKKRTALEQTRFGVTDPDKVAGQVEQDAERARQALRESKKTGVPFLWVGALVLALLCAVLGYLVKPVLYYVAAGLAVVAVVLLILLLIQRKKAAEALEQFRGILRQYDAKNINGIFLEAETHRAAYRACRAAMQTEQESSALVEDAREHQAEVHDNLLHALDFERGDGEAATYFRQKQALEQLCGRLRAEQAKLTGAVDAIGDPMAIESELQTLRQQKNLLEAQYAAIQLACDTLQEADAEIQTRFSPKLAEQAAEYMDFLTEGRYDGVALTRDFAASARRTGDLTPRSAAYLSAGAADLLYLSVRLAMCELTLQGEEPCPIVLDDTLVNFDDQRARRAMELFHEIAQKRQVILFTCHKRDYPDAVIDANII